MAQQEAWAVCTGQGRWNAQLSALYWQRPGSDTDCGLSLTNFDASSLVGVCEGYSWVIRVWFRMYHMQQAAAVHTLWGNLAKFIILKLYHHLGVMKHFDVAIHIYSDCIFGCDTVMQNVSSDFCNFCNQSLKYASMWLVFVSAQALWLVKHINE